MSREFEAYKLSIWVVYDSPLDYPGFYIARKWEHQLLPEPCFVATKTMLAYKRLDLLRDTLEGMGLIKLMRHPTDQPCIVETWL